MVLTLPRKIIACTVLVIPCNCVRDCRYRLVLLCARACKIELNLCTQLTVTYQITLNKKIYLPLTCAFDRHNHAQVSGPYVRRSCGCVTDKRAFDLILFIV